MVKKIHSIHFRGVFLLVFAVLFVFLLQGVSAVTNVSECMVLNTPNEIYQLNKSIESNETCITITAENITLDCQGFTINYSLSEEGKGILSTHNNTTIKNCFINQIGTNSQSHAIDFSLVNNGLIYNNTFFINASSNYGIHLFGGQIII